MTMATEADQPIYALCGVGSSLRNLLRACGPTTLWLDTDVGPPERSFVGLPMGAGDPEAAGLFEPTWAILRVDDADGGLPVLAADGTVAALRFAEAWVFYVGDRRGALETLINLGADRAALAARLATPDAFGIADAGDFGVAVAGRGGYARAGVCGDAFAAMLSIAGVCGRARLELSRGVALVGAHGEAKGGDEAIVVSVGSGAGLHGGRDCVAFSQHDLNAVTIGDWGRAFALGPVGRAEIGNDGVLVVMAAVEARTRVKVGADSRVVLRFPADDGAHRFVFATPGRLGLKAGTEAVFADGAFRDARSWPLNAAEESAARTEIERERHERAQSQSAALAISRQRAAAANDAADPMAGPQTSSQIPTSASNATEPKPVVVLCKLSGDNAGLGVGDTVRAPDWDPDPDSPAGLFGLLGGIGDAGLGQIDHVGNFDEWALVAVEATVAVGPLDGFGHPAAVKFRSGAVLLSGPRRTILADLIAHGADPHRLVGRLAMAGDGGRAVVDRHGAAHAGDVGWAIAGAQSDASAGIGGVALAGIAGYAAAGDDGIAIADEDGIAVVGAGGLALSDGKRYGTAHAGAFGLAIGDGRFKTVGAGFGGVAIATGQGGTLCVGDEGIAVGPGAVTLGRNGVAIGFTSVAAGDGSLLVWSTGAAAGPERYSSAIVGQGGIAANVRYHVEGGALQPLARPGQR